MAIPVTCGGCGSTIEVPEQFAGRRGKCRKCGEAIAIPALSVPAVVETRRADPDVPALATVRTIQEVQPPPLVVHAAPPPPMVAVVSSADTRPCPYCSEAILRDAKKCKHCGEFLDRKLRAKATAPVAAATQVVIHNTMGINMGAAGSMPRWNRFRAGLLSLILPGAGQIYKGQVANGAIWFAAVVGAYVIRGPVGLALHLLCVLGALSGDPYR